MTQRLLRGILAGPSRRQVLTLTDGRVLAGEVTPDSDDQRVELRVFDGTIRIPWGQVLSVGDEPVPG